MAPELFESAPNYSKEVDIWAFGCMAYEIATGLPPNVTNAVSHEHLGAYLKNHPPRLEGGNYSVELRSLIAYCLEELPSSRPAIELVQEHPYIYNTDLIYPTTTLSYLVRAFRLWEDHGGSRKSLAMLSGAQGPADLLSTSSTDDEWNFSTTTAFDQSITRESSARDVYEAYGTGVELDVDPVQDKSHSNLQEHGRGSKRRPPPEALARLRAPLEKIFDPSTLSNYDDNSRDHYKQHLQQPKSDLLLRDDSPHISIRDTMIDLDGYDLEDGGSDTFDLETIRAEQRSQNSEAAPLSDFSEPAHYIPAENNSNRLTRDWKFPTMVSPTFEDPSVATSYEVPEPAASGFEDDPRRSQSIMDAMSTRDSLIDLDMSIPDTLLNSVEPSITYSDAESSEEPNLGNPFELERGMPLYQPYKHGIYANNDLTVPAIFSALALTGNRMVSYGSDEIETLDSPDFSSRYIPMPTLPTSSQRNIPEASSVAYTIEHFPDIPPPPSVAALSGTLSHSEMTAETKRLIDGMAKHLEAFRDIYSSATVMAQVGSMRRQNFKKHTQDLQPRSGL